MVSEKILKDVCPILSQWEFYFAMITRAQGDTLNFSFYKRSALASTVYP